MPMPSTLGPYPLSALCIMPYPACILPCPGAPFRTCSEVCSTAFTEAAAAMTLAPPAAAVTAVVCAVAGGTAGDGATSVVVAAAVLGVGRAGCGCGAETAAACCSFCCLHSWKRKGGFEGSLGGWCCVCSCPLPSWGALPGLLLRLTFTSNLNLQ